MPQEQKITFVAKIKSKPGKEAQVKSELLKLIQPTRAEAGCLSYDMHELLAEPGLFLFYENWKTKKDIDAHFKTPHVLSVLANVSDLLALPPELTSWKLISESK